MYCPFYFFTMDFSRKISSATGLLVNSQERSAGRPQRVANNVKENEDHIQVGDNTNILRRSAGRPQRRGERNNSKRPRKWGTKKFPKDRNEWGTMQKVGTETANGLADLIVNGLLEKSPAGNIK